MVDKELRKIFLNEAMTATATKGDQWHRDPKVTSEFRHHSNKGLYLWATTKFLLLQIQGKSSLNFSFIQRIGLIEKLVKRLNQQVFLERVEVFDPLDYSISRIDAQITLLVRDPRKLFPHPLFYDYRFSSDFRDYGKTSKKKGYKFTGFTFKGDDFFFVFMTKALN
ncbi:MAG: hypothetical protein IPK04_18595 [Bdellovibrionales bacterium]|nr:hypothetical protein [Bdellovibrionales bacterium]